MGLLQGFLGLAVGAAGVVGWFVLRKKVLGDDLPLFGGAKKKKPERAGPNELETFIAAYRAGKVDPATLAGAAARPAVAPFLAPAQPVQRADRSAAFLRPEVKLAYLTFRSALRDHHVFINVQLADLGIATGAARVDVLVLDASFSPVAAADIHREPPPPETGKAGALRAAGIRYLRLSASAMPKPGEIHALIYRA
ncbi:MAG TPA: hypothetical protein VFB20_02620 [Burkholderiales bacterium]|nr:hypothetical protein [Burkholderiales bacterium]